MSCVSLYRPFLNMSPLRYLAEMALLLNTTNFWEGISGGLETWAGRNLTRRCYLKCTCHVARVGTCCAWALRVRIDPCPLASHTDYDT